MFNPKEIKIEDRDLFLNYIGKSENSTLSFTTLFTWSFQNRIRYDIIDDCMVLFFCGKNNCLCTFPYGGGDKLSALKKTYDYMKKQGKPSFALMTEEEARILNQTFPNEFEIYNDEDNQDYVYLTQDLIELKGNKYQQKRNHLNAFLKNYEYTYERLSMDNIDEIKQLFYKWEEGQKNHALGDSNEATMRILDNMDKLGVTAGGIRVDGKLVAFSVGEAITDDMAHIPIEFADTDYRGAFNVINRDFCANEWKDYKYINREEDMGLQGLRYAKRAYCPVKMVEKYRTIYKG